MNRRPWNPAPWKFQTEPVEVHGPIYGDTGRRDKMFKPAPGEPGSPEDIKLINAAMCGHGNPGYCELCENEANVAPDLINSPPHYTSHPSGVEVITITEHMGFCLGNVIKYVLRADLKGDAIEDLRKARWYLDREITRREGAT